MMNKIKIIKKIKIKKRMKVQTQTKQIFKMQKNTKENLLIKVLFTFIKLMELQGKILNHMFIPCKKFMQVHLEFI